MPSQLYFPVEKRGSLFPTIGRQPEGMVTSVVASTVWGPGFAAAPTKGLMITRKMSVVALALARTSTRNSPMLVPDRALSAAGGTVDMGSCRHVHSALSLHEAALSRVCIISSCTGTHAPLYTYSTGAGARSGLVTGT